MKNKTLKLLKIYLALLFFLLSAQAFATDDICINYQGHMDVDGEAYTGTASFKIALCDVDDNTIWANDGTTDACQSAPAAGQDVEVTDGIYSMRLGCEGSMQAITSTLLGTTLNGPYALRVWVKDNIATTYQVLSPDIQVGHSAFAIRAETLQGYTPDDFVLVGDSGLDSDSIADGAITSAKLGSSSTWTFGTGSDATVTIKAGLGSATNPAIRYNATSDQWEFSNDGTSYTAMGGGGGGGSNIVNADIDAAAAIAFSKLASLTSGNILVGSAGNVATSVALSGDATLSNAGALSLASGSVDANELAASISLSDGDLFSLGSINASSTTEGLILPQATNVSAATAEGQISWDTDNDILYVGNGAAAAAVSNPFGSDISNAEINAAAAIDFSKLATLTSGNILVGSAGNVATSVALSGDATLSNAGALTIADNSIDGTDIALGSDAQGDIMYYNGTDWVRLAAGTDGDYLETNGAGQNPAWSTVPTTIADNSIDGTDIALGSDAQGDIMYYNGTDWVRLAAGTDGDYLETNGAGQNPAWSTVSAGVGTAANPTWTGQHTFTKNPATGAVSSATILVNPGAATDDSYFLALQDNGTDRFTVDAEGDTKINGNLAVNGFTIMGDGSGNNVTLVSITADDQVVTPTTSVIAVESDDGTAANRTFTLPNPAYTGQMLIIILRDVTDQVQLQNSGNTLLSADWNPNSYGDSITLVGLNSAVDRWVETSRTDVN